MQVAILTGGDDAHYALGLAEALLAHGVTLDFIGSDEFGGDELDDSQLRRSPRLRFFNLRKDTRPDVSKVRKVVRIALYYGRLILYAATSRPKIFHILWSLPIVLLDRTLVMFYYRALGKRVVLTVHNVNAGWRDGNDSFLNRLSLKIQYRLCHHLFVHTEAMKRELRADFDVPEVKVSVIPYPINNRVPSTALSGTEARERLGLNGSHKVMLYFGQIAPYKGLEYLLEAMVVLTSKDADYRLVVAGHLKHCPAAYWETIKRRLSNPHLSSFVIERIEFVADADIEIYFKAADVIILPYVYIFQSGVLFLSYNFGLPVIATDVGSLRNEVLEGKTGFICPPRNPAALAKEIAAYFESDLYRQLSLRRCEIQEFGNRTHSWARVGNITTAVYGKLLVPT